MQCAIPIAIYFDEYAEQVNVAVRTERKKNEMSRRRANEWANRQQKRRKKQMLMNIKHKWKSRKIALRNEDVLAAIKVTM